MGFKYVVSVGTTKYPENVRFLSEAVYYDHAPYPGNDDYQRSQIQEQFGKIRKTSQAEIIVPDGMAILNEGRGNNMYFFSGKTDSFNEESTFYVQLAAISDEDLAKTWTLSQHTVVPPPFTIPMTLTLAELKNVKLYGFGRESSTSDPIQKFYAIFMKR